ncbi:MAG: hypothetical protein ACE5PV_07210 [Candidatus Poribacteria bacterium]
MNLRKLLVIPTLFFPLMLISAVFSLQACKDKKSIPSSTTRHPVHVIQQFSFAKPPTEDIKSKKLDELSGIAPARGEEEYWGHNDKGNDAEIFRFNSRGKIIQKVELKGARNVDWEGMTSGSNGDFYIADTGDNKLRRDLYRIYKFTEPKTSAKKIKNIGSYKFKYADGKPHNCEAVFAMNDKLYLISKEQKVKQKIFCIDKLKAGETISAREVGRLDISGRVTDAAYSPERKQLAALTEKAISFYNVAKESDLLKPPIYSTHIRFGQCEALCYDGDYLVVTNEPGKIWRYPLEAFWGE